MHAKKDSHLRAVDHRAYEFKKTWLNPSTAKYNAKNFRFHSEVLPAIVEGVLLCARQRIASQAHQQENIDFSHPSMRISAIL